MPDLPFYQCHKQVRALKIVGVEDLPATTINADDGSAFRRPGGIRLLFEAPFDPIDKTAEWAIRHDVKAGGYYVVYEDGYASFSPADAFEDGYTRIIEE